MRLTQKKHCELGTYVARYLNENAFKSIALQGAVLIADGSPSGVQYALRQQIGVPNTSQFPRTNYWIIPEEWFEKE